MGESANAKRYSHSATATAVGVAKKKEVQCMR